MYPLYYTSTALNQYSFIYRPGDLYFSPQYDNDGNMLAMYGGWLYTWDGENRLVKAAQGDVEVHFTYDYMSRRVKKKVEKKDEQDVWTTDLHLAYIYDGWNLLQEIDVSGSTQQTVRQYVWGLDLSQSLQGAGGVGGLLAAVHGSAVYYPCFDANGNITQYVDSSSGTEVARYDYDAFGRVFYSSGDMANAFVFRFSTKYTDDETGLVYYGYRYLNPELGRWMNRDPIGERGGLNLYAFVGNGALFNIDLFGLSGCVRNYNYFAVKQCTIKIFIGHIEHLEAAIDRGMVDVEPCAGTLAVVCNSNSLIRPQEQGKEPKLPDVIPGARGSDLVLATGAAASQPGPMRGDLFMLSPSWREAHSMCYYVDINLDAARAHAPRLCRKEHGGDDGCCCDKVTILPLTMSLGFPTYSMETYDCGARTWTGTNTRGGEASE